MLGLLAAQKGLLLEAAEVLGSDRIAGYKASLLRFAIGDIESDMPPRPILPELLS